MMVDRDVGEVVKRPDHALRLWVAQIMIAVVASVWVVFRRISIPHCDLECDFDLLRTAGDTFVLGAVALVAIVGVSLPVLRRVSSGSSRRWDWSIPAMGIVVTLVGALVANQLSDVAMLF